MQLMRSTEVTLADIRDQVSFLASHIQGAGHLNNDNIEQFIADNPKDRPLIIYCYHGNSSQNAAQFFSQQGYTEVYSMDGGFEQWRGEFPSSRT